MKKQWFLAALLIACDQFVKLIIFNNCMGKLINLIPGVLQFEPFQNTNLNWLASMADFVMPVFIMLVLQFSIAIGLTLFYRYQRFMQLKPNLWLSLGFCMALAGIGCSFIDVLFWGGSLDYIGLFNWFIFDMKDIFLNAGWISLVIWLNSKAYKTKKTESISLKSWFSSGCKLT